MILVDTTVWVDFFRGNSGGHVKALEELISNDEEICTCGVILAEVLQGIKLDRDFFRTKNFFEALAYLPVSKETFLQSSRLYRSLRKKGATIRKPIDCMIASVAIDYNLPLLHNDRDFFWIACHSKLRIFKIE
ncbi:MAG: PIN domain nuclease [Candidatus Sabulitectum sp.]|nr:PIN domain nuclease [Candidatus Sabulitectum sp.]